MEQNQVTILYERQLQPVVQIFDLEDRYARERGMQGSHPRPMGPIKFSVVGQVTDSGRQYFNTPQDLVIRRNPSGYHLFFGAVRLSTGELRHAFQTAGTYIVRIESRYYQPVEVDVDLPMPDRNVPAAFNLLPGYAYPFPRGVLPGIGGPTLLRGSVVDGDGRGRSRVTIEVVGQEEISYWTDATGQWVLTFPETQPSGNVSLRFILPDSTSEVIDDVPIQQGKQSSLAPVVLVG